MKNTLSAIFLIGMLLTASDCLALKPDDIVGRWLTGLGNAQVNIYKNNAGLYMGSIVWLREPLDSITKQPKTDNKNPDKSLRSTPLMGLLMLKNFKWDADAEKYTGGTIYDPKTGNTYSCKITLKSMNEMDLRGYIGISLIGRTDHWTRVKS